MKTCFVISPIGQEGSDIRQDSDDLFDLIIEPALEKFDFNVIRADKIFNTTSINDDIISYIQKAELCIIDLTSHNPNVFYEAGRRHETAKPFIHVKRKGEQIPFDIAGIRTIDYDLSDGRKIKESIDTLRKFIIELEQIGYTSQSSGASLNSIATTLTRIERKLDSINVSAGSPVAPQDVATQNGLRQDPLNAFYTAFDSGNYPLAVAALQKFMKVNLNPNLHLDMASSIVEAYEPAGVPIVRGIIEKDFDQLTSSMLGIALDALYRFFYVAQTLKDEYDYLKNTANKVLQRNLTDKEKAAIYNVIASIEFSMKNDIKALEYQKKTIEYDPEQPIYYYNIATIYKELKMKDELVSNLNTMITIYQNRDPQKEKINTKYLEYARDTYSKLGLNDKASQAEDLIAMSKKYVAPPKVI